MKTKSVSIGIIVVMVSCIFFPISVISQSDLTGYFPLTPGNWLIYNSTDDITTWNTRRLISEDTQFINGGPWGVFTVKWTEEHQYEGEDDFHWVNHMWLSKRGSSLIWWGFEDKWLRIVAYWGLKYVSEPVQEGTVLQGKTRATLKIKEEGKTIPFVPFSGIYTIEAIESVVTPAGTFDNCIKVHEQEITPDGEISFWVWYAPNMAAVKYFYPQQENRTDVLIDYQIDLEGDPWDTWFLPKVPYLTWAVTGVILASVITVLVISRVKKRKR